MFNLKKKNKTEKEEKDSIEVLDESPVAKDVVDSFEDEDTQAEEDEELTEEGQLSVDVYQDKANVVIRSTIAGVEPEDIDITFDNDMITIRGKRKKDTSIREENYFYQECYWGSFSRSIILPVEVQADKIKASIRNGVLTIVLPKSHKDINIKVEEED